jgi:hypothetical protein
MSSKAQFEYASFEELCDLIVTRYLTFGNTLGLFAVDQRK